MPAGSWEYEQWVTWKGHQADDHDFDRFDLRHELEYGVTDRLRLALYYDWRYEDGEGGSGSHVSFHDVAVETMYQVLDPVNDPFGFALYLEAKLGDDSEFFELEPKLIVSKNIDRWILVWNGYLEAEWEGQGYDEQNGVFGETAGVSYEFTPRFRAGVEAQHEIERESWEEWGHHVVYVGPNASYRAGRWWATLTPTVQATNVNEEPDYLVRLIIGVDL
jgi:hypothetical protein